MKAIIHIGLNKTGTTSLQKSLHSSRKLLLEHGVLYPNLEDCQHLSLMPLFLEEPESFVRSRKRGLNRRQALEWGQSQALSLDQQIQTSEASLCILSSEFFSILDTTEIQRFKSFVEERFEDYSIIVYVRTAKDLYSSILQESIKTSNRPLEDNLYPWIFKSPARERLEKYLTVFDPETLKVINYSNNTLGKNNIIQDFISRTNIPSIIESGIENSSLSEIHIALLFLLNQNIQKWNDNGEFNKQWSIVKSLIIGAVEHLDETRESPRFKIKNPLWNEAVIASNFENDKWIDNTFFEGKRSYFKSEQIQTDTQENLDQSYSSQDFKEYITAPLTVSLLFKILLINIEKNQENIDKSNLINSRLQKDRDRILSIQNKLHAEKEVLISENHALMAERERLRKEIQTIRKENIHIKEIIGVKQLLYFSEKFQRLKEKITKTE